MKRIVMVTGCWIGIVTMGVAQDKPAEHKERRMERHAGLERGMMEGDMSMMQIQKHLDLSKEQMQQMRSIFSGSTNEMKTLQSRMQEAARAQAVLMSQDMPNEEAVLKGADEIAKIRAEIGRIRLKQMLETRKILTPEQRVKMREKMTARMEKNRSEGGRMKRPDRGSDGKADAESDGKAK
jgi:Spy/CpxP family protein refolding chaperone